MHLYLLLMHSCIVRKAVCSNVLYNFLNIFILKIKLIVYFRDSYENKTRRKRIALLLHRYYRYLINMGIKNRENINKSDGNKNILFININALDSPASPPAFGSEQMSKEPARVIPVVCPWKLIPVDIPETSDINFDLKLIQVPLLIFFSR